MNDSSSIYVVGTRIKRRGDCGPVLAPPTTAEEGRGRSNRRSTPGGRRRRKRRRRPLEDVRRSTMST
jgi:hypothetical protein